MAFIRKHRERYWLVHNFRTGDKVRQVRLYPFDLHADPEHEMAQAQSAVETLYPGQIASTWVATVRQQLQQLRDECLQTHWDSQVTQITQHLQALLQALERFDGPPATQQHLAQECVAQLQRQPGQAALEPVVLAPRQPDMFLTMAASAAPARDSGPSQALGDGFYLGDRTISHACAATQASPDGFDPDAGVGASPMRSAVVRVSLIQGRDLWLECQGCHARWHDFTPLEALLPLQVQHQKISKFERFCAERKVGDACEILVQYRSGRVERLSGTVQTIDYAAKKVHVVTTRGKTPQTYWRQVEHVYFGTLEVQLTEVQRRQVLAAGQGEPHPLSRTWYAVADTPDMRLLLQQLQVRY